MFGQRCLFKIGIAVFVSTSTLLAQTISPGELAKKVAAKFQAAKEYAFEGSLEITRKNGNDIPATVLETDKVRLSIGSGGKCLLEVDGVNKPSYEFISDGLTSWAYMPSLKRYTEGPTAENEHPCQPSLDTPNGPLQDFSAADFIRRAVSILAGLDQRITYTDIKGNLLTVMSQKDARDRQELVYLTLDTGSLAIKKLAWLLAAPAPGGDKTLMRYDLVFQSLRINEPGNDSDYTFAPPNKAKRVKTLPVSGATKRL